MNKKLSIAIVGSGRIGMSLVALFTGNGYDTVVFSMGAAFTQDGKSHYQDIYETLVQRKLQTVAQAAAAAERLSFTEAYADLRDVDVVFECAVEDKKVKADIYRELEIHCPALQAIVSTTSALSANDLAAGLAKYKDIMMVAHPFNPPHLVPFVEMEKNSNTTEESARLVYELLESTGRKVVIMKKGAPGFIANRLQHALLREAFYMIEQGYADARDIDKALMYSFMPRYTSVGLFEHQDAAGLDMVVSIEDYLFPYLGAGQKAPDYITKKLAEGKLGQKSGEGIYRWDQEQIQDFQRRAAEPYWRYFNWNTED